MIVCDSSPLIALAYLDKIPLLDRLFVNWWIPSAIFKECTINGRNFADFFSTILSSRIKIPTNRLLIEVLSLQIGKGEAESIVLARELGIDLILIDDKKGRKYATIHNLNPIGTIGFLLAAKKRGLFVSSET